MLDWSSWISRTWAARPEGDELKEEVVVGRKCSVIVFFVLIAVSSGVTWAGDGGFNGLPLGIDLPNPVDGSETGYVRIADDDALEPQTLTIEAWIHPLGPGYNSEPVIVGKTMEGHSGSWIWAWVMIWHPGTGAVSAWLTHDVGAAGTSCSSIGSVAMGASAHVAMTFDGTWLRVFIDGQLDNEAAASSANVDYQGQDLATFVGAGNFAPGWLRRFDGIIDEVRIWDHARDAAEIAGQMNCALSGDEPGLLAYYSFNMGDARDDSDQGRDGVIEGTADYVNYSQDCMIHFDGFDDGTALAWN